MNRKLAAIMLVALVWSNLVYCDEIHNAAQSGNPEKVKLLLKRNPDLISSKDDQGETPLHLAVDHGKVNVVRVLLSKKADVNARNDAGQTPLHLAAGRANVLIAQLLLQYKGNVNATNDAGQTPLHVAAGRGNISIAELLLQYRSNVNARDTNGVTPLHVAAANGNQMMARLLLSCYADIRAKDKAGETPWQIASKHGHTNMVDMLLGGYEASGTGFFITDDGYLVSNNHVVFGAVKVRVVTGTGTNDARVVRVDVTNDLALLKVEGHFSALPIASSSAVQLGSTVATVGFPDPGLQGFSPKLSKGEIASLSGLRDDPRCFQISVPVQPGNSGGALVDEHGNVVGVVSAKLSSWAALAATGAMPEDVNYAVKSSLILNFLKSDPEVLAKLKPLNTTAESFADEVNSAQQAAVLIRVDVELARMTGRY